MNAEVNTSEPTPPLQMADNHSRAKKVRKRYEDREGEGQNEWMSDGSLKEKGPQREVRRERE